MDVTVNTPNPWQPALPVGEPFHPTLRVVPIETVLLRIHRARGAGNFQKCDALVFALEKAFPLQFRWQCGGPIMLPIKGNS